MAYQFEEDQLKEIVWTSGASGKPWNTCVWDPRAGTSLMTYKGGSAEKHTLCLLGHDHVLSAEPGKPIIHHWAINKHKQSPPQIESPGKVSAFTSTPDGEYCAAGIAKLTYVWQTGTGFLVAKLKGHCQKVSCLAFSHDEAFLVSGGEDGQVLVWQTSKVIGNCGDNAHSWPLHTFSCHTLKVEDISLGIGGFMASVSMDKSCKLYNLYSGAVVFNCICSVGLTSVTLNYQATELYIGDTNGNIYYFSVRDASLTPEFYISQEHKYMFIEHNKAVVCLSVSADNLMLLSGSKDEKAIIWDIASRKVLHILPHKGAVTNAFFSIASKNIFSKDLKATLLLRSLQHEAPSKEDQVIEVLVTERPAWQSRAMKERAAALEMQDNGDFPPLVKSLTSYKDELKEQKMEKINEELFNFAVEELLQPQDESAQTATVTEESHAEEEESYAEEEESYAEEEESRAEEEEGRAEEEEGRAEEEEGRAEEEEGPAEEEKGPAEEEKGPAEEEVQLPEKSRPKRKKKRTFRYQ